MNLEDGEQNIVGVRTPPSAGEPLDRPTNVSGVFAVRSKSHPANVSGSTLILQGVGSRGDKIPTVDLQ